MASNDPGQRKLSGPVIALIVLIILLVLTAIGVIIGLNAPAFNNNDNTGTTGGPDPDEPVV